MPSKKTYDFSIIEDAYGRAFKTTVLKPQKEVKTAIEEAIDSARQLCLRYPDKNFALVLSQNYESAATLEAFLKAKVKFSVLSLQIKSASDALKQQDSLVKLCQKLYIDHDVVEFDFLNTTHLNELDHIAEQINCNQIKILLDIWATCQTDDIPILPGHFTFPTNPVKKSEFKFNLPGPAEKKYFDFFEQFEGEPFFLGSTPELVASFLSTQIAHEAYSYYLSEQDAIDYTDQTKKILFSDANFSDEFIFFEKPIDTFKHVISKYKSMEISRYEALKNKKYSAENQYRTHIQELGFDFKFDTLCELRTETKKLTYGFMGAGYQYETEFSQNHGKTTSLILFPKLVTLQHYESDLTSLAKFIEEQNYYPNFQNLGSDNDLHSKAEMTDLVRFFKKSVFDFLKQTGQLVEDVQITQCWANKTNFGNSHHRHEHPNSFISGVFYLTSGGGGNIIFHQNEYKTIMPILHEQNMFNSNTFQIKPKKGLLVLFPSSYTHSTQVNTAESPRYSIAFNVLPKGQVGHWETAAWANL